MLQVRGKYIIYGLVDPRDRLVYYGGYSTRGLERPKEHGTKHLNEQSPKGEWIRSLRALGLDYEIVILEDVVKPHEIAVSPRCFWYPGLNPSNIKDAERWWVAYGRALGWPLLNRNAAGAGGLDPCPETRAKMSASAKARTDDRAMPLETRKKIGVAQRGVPERPEVAAASGARLRDPEFRAIALQAYRQWCDTLTDEERSARGSHLVTYRAEHPELQAVALAAAMTPAARRRARDNQMQPESYAKMVVAGKERWESEEYRNTVIPQFRTAALIRWQDPIYHDEQQAKMQAGRKPIPPASCGTTAGWMRHITNEEKPCGACRDARNRYRRESGESSKRRAKQPKHPRKLEPCGTRSSYVRNKRLADQGESNCGPCEACREAARQYKRIHG